MENRFFFIYMRSKLVVSIDFVILFFVRHLFSRWLNFSHINFYITMFPFNPKKQSKDNFLLCNRNELRIIFFNFTNHLNFRSPFARRFSTFVVFLINAISSSLWSYMSASILYNIFDDLQ